MDNDFDFDFSEEELTDKLVYTIYGEKGSGKSTSSLSFDGKIVCLSFDHKSITIKDEFFKERKIKVFDGVRYYEKSPKTQTKSAYKTFHYLQDLLNKFVNSENKPDWIVIDGLEVLNVICEMAMRYDRQYKPYQGISNLNDWKYRNDMLNQLHLLSVKGSNKGVIYTTYTKIQETMEDGVVIEKKEIPKWFGNVLMETDIVLKTVVSSDNKGNPTYKVWVNSSKRNEILKTGKTYLVDIEKGFIEN